MLANNNRFLILPWVCVKHLASHILGRVCRRINMDFMAKYLHPVHLLETFVEKDRFSGTCYQAANWQNVGDTKGRGKLDTKNECKLPVKSFWLYPLSELFRDAFMPECRFVLECLQKVYHNDALTKEKNMSPAERLLFHQENSQAVMTELKTWLDKQLQDILVEPNSSLGKAIKYMLKRWEALTGFLRIENAPLDNNVAERALKKAILNRKNGLFFKTEFGAYVGDIFISLIQTCVLAKVNAFEYLTALQENSAKVQEEPVKWLPWNYKENFAA